MVINPVKTRAPAVIAEEIPVLKHCPAVLADHAAVIGIFLIFLMHLFVGQLGSRGSGGRNLAAHEQGKGEEGIGNTRQETPASQATHPNFKLFPQFFAQAGLFSQYLGRFR